MLTREERQARRAVEDQEARDHNRRLLAAHGQGMVEPWTRPCDGAVFFPIIVKTRTGGKLHQSTNGSSVTTCGVRMRTHASGMEVTHKLSERHLQHCCEKCFPALHQEKESPVDARRLRDMADEVARLTTNAGYFARRAVDADDVAAALDDLETTRARLEDAIRLINAEIKNLDPR